MTTEERATDCWITPEPIAELVGELWGQPTWDPFADPEQIIDAEYEAGLEGERAGRLRAPMGRC